MGAQVQMSPFMRTISPCGLPWSQYLATALVEVDPHTGLLTGPWAEGLCWAVRFEHSSDWQSMPEYACAGDGPAGGVMIALEAALGGRHAMHAGDELQAASRLEEAMHCAAELGHPMPIIDGPSALVPLVEPVPMTGQPVLFESLCRRGR